MPILWRIYSTSISPGGEVSERQWGDVLGILRVQGPLLDYLYLHHWAGQLGVAALLVRALADAAL